jgi:hypothetical protein
MATIRTYSAGAEAALSLGEPGGNAFHLIAHLISEKGRVRLCTRFSFETETFCAKRNSPVKRERPGGHQQETEA